VEGQRKSLSGNPELSLLPLQAYRGYSLGRWCSVARIVEKFMAVSAKHDTVSIAYSVIPGRHNLGHLFLNNFATRSTGPRTSR
jgi:hypothetical protein